MWEKEADGLAPSVWKNLAHGAELLCVGCHHFRIHLASKNQIIYPSVSRCSASTEQLSSMVGLKMCIESHYQHTLLKTLRSGNCEEQLLFCNTVSTGIIWIIRMYRMKSKSFELQNEGGVITQNILEAY